MTLRHFPSYCLAFLLVLFANNVASAQGGTHAYLLRGIFNVSVGLDELAGKLARQGIPSSVYGHGESDDVAAQAIRDYRSGKVRSIILIGHSLGAGAVVSVADQLNDARVPVSVLISLDPVGTMAVPPNVRRVVNFYISGSGAALAAGPGFHGSLQNIDVSDVPGMDHMAIQATAAMHRRMISYLR
jgi:pimeloyl-ACP methyl ester carboxylesterase